MLKKSLFFLFAIIMVTMATLVVVLNNYNPYQSGYLIYFLFYFSLFLILSGVISIIIFYSKIYIFKNSLLYTLFKPSLRQGVIISLGLVALLLLQGLKVLDFWVGIPLVIVIVLIELFFQTKSKQI